MSTTSASATQQDCRLRVFLCHASDDKPVVRDLYERLKKDGFAPWLDEKDLLPGEKWKEKIQDALRACDVVVVCISQKSVSKEGFLHKEILGALSVAEEKPAGTIFIIPARLEDVGVPKHLSEWHSANLFQEDGYQQLTLALKVRADHIGVTIIAAEKRPADKSVAELRPEREVDWRIILNAFLNAVAVAVIVIVLKFSPPTWSEQATGNPVEIARRGDISFFVYRDYKQADQLYEQAAALGDPYAKYRLGISYECGFGVTKDDEQARLWYKKAADSGNRNAQEQLQEFSNVVCREIASR